MDFRDDDKALMKMKKKVTLNKYKKDLDNERELSSRMKKQLSPTRAVLRIIIGFFGFLLWIFIGVSPTIIFSSGIQEFIGTFSFLIRNPIIFLLIAFINIILGVIVYIFIGILWWAVFHILWSIRWFYGFRKYHKLKKNTLKI